MNKKALVLDTLIFLIGILLLFTTKILIVCSINIKDVNFFTILLVAVLLFCGVFTMITKSRVRSKINDRLNIVIPFIYAVVYMIIYSFPFLGFVGRLGINNSIVLFVSVLLCICGVYNYIYYKAGKMNKNVLNNKGLKDSFLCGEYCISLANFVLLFVGVFVVYNMAEPIFDASTSPIIIIMNKFWIKLM